MLIILFLASLAFGAPTKRSTINGTVVDLGYTLYEGFHNATAGYTIWYGLKYAAAPTGDLRWRPPQAIEENNNYTRGEILNATKQGNICIQGTPAWELEWEVGNYSSIPVQSGDEDCLLLDVLVPSNPVSDALPVMVQIHGGGYTQGNSEYYPGFEIVEHSQGSLIYVSIQYRLGPWGFLASEDVRRDGVANAGLLDQRAALEWIQRHIAAFGGDPSRVTIIGGSAGGGSVAAQMIMYGGVKNPPFWAAVAEYPWWQPYHPQYILEAQYRQLLNFTNCTDLACLRSVSEETLRIASEVTYVLGYYVDKIYGFGDFYYGPIVDGDIIREYPSIAFAQGRFSRVPLLTNREGYEGYGFSNQSEANIAEETSDLEQVFPYWRLNPDFFGELYSLYPASDFNSTFYQRSTLFGDDFICCPSQWMANFVSESRLPTYKLIFNAGDQKHGATKQFVFLESYQPAIFWNETLGMWMKDWYISFAAHLDPNMQSWSNSTYSSTKPFWPTYISRGTYGQVMDINYTQAGVLKDLDIGPRCDWWFQQTNVVWN